jgi:hypothetical protein
MDEDQFNEATHRRAVEDRIGELQTEFLRRGVEPPEYIETCWTLGEFADVLRARLQSLT